MDPRYSNTQIEKWLILIACHTQSGFEFRALFGIPESPDGVFRILGWADPQTLPTEKRKICAFDRDDSRQHWLFEVSGISPREHYLLNRTVPPRFCRIKIHSRKTRSLCASSTEQCEADVCLTLFCGARTSLAPEDPLIPRNTTPPTYICR
jgi:hypothetical protein